MSRARHELPRSTGRSRLIAAVAVISVIAAGLVVRGIRSDDGSGAQQGPAAVRASASNVSSVPSTRSSAEPESAARSTGEACATEIAATQAVVDASRVASAHWREHVQARTDLLAGKNSEAATRAIWKRTRLAGPADLAKLGAAVEQQQELDGACAKLTSGAAVACKQRLTALDGAGSQCRPRRSYRLGESSVHDGCPRSRRLRRGTRAASVGRRLDERTTQS